MLSAVEGMGGWIKSTEGWELQYHQLRPGFYLYIEGVRKAKLHSPIPGWPEIHTSHADGWVHEDGSRSTITPEEMNRIKDRIRQAFEFKEYQDEPIFI